MACYGACNEAALQLAELLVHVFGLLTKVGGGRLGFRVWVQGLGFRVWGLGFKGPCSNVDSRSYGA